MKKGGTPKCRLIFLHYLKRVKSYIPKIHMADALLFSHLFGGF